MDTGSDFVKPEFLNALFFQQKNVVVFPHMDLKHLKHLELFTVGYNIVDLESTAIHDLKGFLELEANNSYSQKPTLYFVYNLDEDKVKEIMSMENVRCVLNSNADLRTIANGSDFLFYNKKNGAFLNFQLSESDLEFEKQLISSSESETVLLDKVQRIKIVATRIFEQINESPNESAIAEILKEYDPKHWKKILNFVKLYFKVEVPDISRRARFAVQEKERSKKIKLQPVDPERKDSFLGEYNLIMSQNKFIGREFVQTLHDYRSRKVNPSNLALEQLYNPKELYVYLRFRHWKEGIPVDFLLEWVQMNNSNYELSADDKRDFKVTLEKLGFKEEIFVDSKSQPVAKGKSANRKKPKRIKTKPAVVPPVSEFSSFKKWLLKKLDGIEDLLS